MKTLFVSQDNSYRYSYTKKQGDRAGVLLLRVCKAKLASFLKDNPRISQNVDVLAQGGGWYQITAVSDNTLVFGVPTDDLSLWLFEFNRHHYRCVPTDTSVGRYPVQYVKRVKHKTSSMSKLESLLQTFSKVTS